MNIANSFKLSNVIPPVISKPFQISIYRNNVGRLGLIAALLLNLAGFLLGTSAHARSNEVQLQFPDKCIGLLHLVREVNSGTGISVESTIFARATGLASLNVAATNIDTCAKSSLCKLQNLTELQLAGNGKINDADVKKLGVLKNLKSLDLKDTGITPASIATFKTFPKLKILAVSYPPQAVKLLQRELPKVSITSTNSRPYPKELFSPLH